MSDLTRPGPSIENPASRGDHQHLNRSWHGQGLEGGDSFQPVLTIRARVDEAQAAAFIRSTLQEIHAYINDRQLEITGPPFSICHHLPQHTIDVEAGWPVRSANGTDRIGAGTIPTRRLGPHANPAR